MAPCGKNHYTIGAERPEFVKRRMTRYRVPMSTLFRMVFPLLPCAQTALWVGLVAWNTGCQPAILPPGVLPTSAAAWALADGVLTCDEHQARSVFNECPSERPETGTDAAGITWKPDLIFGLRNPYHTPLDCFRGTSAMLTPSSYQCCYDGVALVAEGPRAGSIDLFNPDYSLLGHILYDVLPMYRCGGW